MPVTVVSNVQQCFVNLKGIEAQLSIMALNSRDEEAQRVFHETMTIIGEIKSDLQKRILIMQREEPQYKG